MKAVGEGAEEVGPGPGVPGRDDERLAVGDGADHRAVQIAGRRRPSVLAAGALQHPARRHGLDDPGLHIGGAKRHRCSLNGHSRRDRLHRIVAIGGKAIGIRRRPGKAEPPDPADTHLRDGDHGRSRLVRIRGGVVFRHHVDHIARRFHHCRIDEIAAETSWHIHRHGVGEGGTGRQISGGVDPPRTIALAAHGTPRRGFAHPSSAGDTRRQGIGDSRTGHGCGAVVFDGDRIDAVSAIQICKAAVVYLHRQVGTGIGALEPEVIDEEAGAGAAYCRSTVDELNGCLGICGSERVLKRLPENGQLRARR